MLVAHRVLNIRLHIQGIEKSPSTSPVAMYGIFRIPVAIVNDTLIRAPTLFKYFTFASNEVVNKFDWAGDSKRSEIVVITARAAAVI